MHLQSARFQLTKPIIRMYPIFECFALVTMVVILVGLVSCSNSKTRLDGSDTQQSVRGIILRVESSSVTRVDILEIQDYSGVVWHFTPDGSYRGFMPSHLREHMLQALPVTVRYHKFDNVLKMYDVVD